MAEKRKRLPEEVAVDRASIAMLQKADTDGVAGHAFSRADAQRRACKVGLQGVCCRVCHMGPCNVSESRPGICGATADTVAARNLLREVAVGTAAHADHGRHLVLLLKAIGEGRGGDYQIRDEARLRAVARTWGVEEAGRITARWMQRMPEILRHTEAPGRWPLATAWRRMRTSNGSSPARQIQRYACALPDSAFDLDVTAMRFYNALSNRHP